MNTYKSNKIKPIVIKAPDNRIIRIKQVMFDVAIILVIEFIVIFLIKY